MKKEYIDLFDNIKPSEELEKKILSNADKNKKISFVPKKFVAMAAAFILIIGGGFGVYRASSNNVFTPHNSEQQQSVSSALDFSIVAYAKDGENNVKVLSDDDITLMNMKITLNEDSGEYSISTESNDEELSVRSDSDIEEVTFESENGSFSYLDIPLKNYLVSQKKFYSAVIPITETQYNEFNSTVFELEGKGTSDFKEKFVKDLINSKDCSKYIYDKDFDVSKISTDEYSVDCSDMAGTDENYYDYCVLIKNKAETAVILHNNENNLVAKTYQTGDEIGYVHYLPDEAINYLLENPNADFSELPTDTIKITVTYKNGQSATKEIFTQFNSDGVLTMRYK